MVLQPYVLIEQQVALLEDEEREFSSFNFCARASKVVAESTVSDYDEDGIQDLMVKFERVEVIDLVSIGEVMLTITGKVAGITFEGSDTIRVIDE